MQFCSVVNVCPPLTEMHMSIQCPIINVKVKGTSHRYNLPMITNLKLKLFDIWGIDFTWIEVYIDCCRLCFEVGTTSRWRQLCFITMKVRVS